MALSPEQFGDRLVELLPRLMQEISRHENNYITTGKITCQQFVALEFISRHANCPMNEFVRSVGVSFSAATGMIDRLVKHRLVTRHRGKEDRRMVYVSATVKGRKIVQEVYGQKKKGMIELFRKVSPHDRQTYLEILEKLVARLATTKGE